MSFSLILQKNKSEKNALNKTLETVATLTGTLKGETSLIDPVIVIESATVPNANYMTITEFGRSYFINNVRSIRSNLWEISSHVDVLSSFKNEILNNDAIIGRNENAWNLYIDDGEFRLYNNPKTTTHKFVNGSSFTTSNATYVLAVSGSSPVPQ